MMKKLSILFLIVVSVGIFMLTFNTIRNPGIRIEEPKNVHKTIEKVNENVTKEEASLLFNIYLNEVRHKFKISYRLELTNDDEDETNLVAYVYLDGTNILKKNVKNSVNKKLVDIWNDETSNKYLTKDIDSFTYLKEKDEEYLVFSLPFISNDIKELLYIINDDGKLLDKDGFVISDTNNVFVDENDVDISFLYNGKFAKIEDNTLYYLNEEIKDDIITFYEFKASIKKGELEKKLINTYNNIKIKDLTE